MVDYCFAGTLVPQRFRDIFAAEQYRPVFFGERSDVAELRVGEYLYFANYAVSLTDTTVVEFWYYRIF